MADMAAEPPPAGPRTLDTARVEFEAFFERRYRELGRFAYLLTGDSAASDDLTGDVMLAAWRQWDRVQAVDEPVAYVRRIMVNLAATRIRRLSRERKRMALFLIDAEHSTSASPDGAAVVDVRAALQQLPARRRACVVLRHAFDLSEREVADSLGVSVGTVKSQTSKGVAQLQRLLGDNAEERWLR